MLFFVPFWEGWVLCRVPFDVIFLDMGGMVRHRE